ncbi:hypothetical protein GQ55_1G321600 [Panicum hallii var. hallii]|uniref:Uncharacterized protein n=1 Tax=Panicum hallii var. hallii TaxID=1504633 RepID=A0A2T7F9T6_9POAL|nr:hypothetical protein GQ55_1G321600 [Panicum hallii var. hallii]
MPCHCNVVPCLVFADSCSVFLFLESNLTCNFVCPMMIDVRLVSLHSQLPPKSFRPARLES